VAFFFVEVFFLVAFLAAFFFFATEPPLTEGRESTRWLGRMPSDTDT